MEFNVTIRTLLCRDDQSVTLSVGGGVVYDSTARDEYDEALLKSRFTYLGEGRFKSQVKRYEINGS